MIKRVLVTGTSGFLGSYLVRDLLGRPEIETVLSLSRRYHPLFTGRPRFHQIRHDGLPDALAEREIRALAPDLIVHAAAMATVAECERYPEGSSLANVELSRRVLAIAESCGAHVVFVSTDLVFDGSRACEGGFSEEESPSPLSTYARTKRRAEELFLGSPSASVVRISLLYGAPIGEARGPLAWMLDSLAAGEPTVLFSDEWRTPLHVEDAAAAAIELGSIGAPGLYHCGGPRRINRIEMGELVCEAFGYDRRAIVPKLRGEAPSTPERPEDTSLCSDKLASLLGRSFDPPSEGLKRVARTIRKGGPV